jgi:hypothetical protein
VTSGDAAAANSQQKFLGFIPIKNSWDLFPPRIPGIYSHQKFLGFIPIELLGFMLFKYREQGQQREQPAPRFGPRHTRARVSD